MVNTLGHPWRSWKRSALERRDQKGKWFSSELLCFQFIGLNENEDCIQVDAQKEESSSKAITKQNGGKYNQ